VDINRRKFLKTTQLVSLGALIQPGAIGQLFQTRNSMSVKKANLGLPAILKVIGVGEAGIESINYMQKEGITGIDSGMVSCRASDRSQMSYGYMKSFSLCSSGPDIVFIVTAIEDLTRGTDYATAIGSRCKEQGALTICVVTQPSDLVELIKRPDRNISRILDNYDIIIPVQGKNGSEALRHNQYMAVKTLAESIIMSGPVDPSRIISYPTTIIGFNTQRLFSHIDSLSRDYHESYVPFSGPEETGLNYPYNIFSLKGLTLFSHHNLSANDRHRSYFHCATSLCDCQPTDYILQEAKSIFVNITCGPDLSFQDIYNIIAPVTAFSNPDADICYGVAADKSIKDRVKIAIVGTGFKSIKS